MRNNLIYANLMCSYITCQDLLLLLQLRAMATSNSCTPSHLAMVRDDCVSLSDHCDDSVLPCMLSHLSLQQCHSPRSATSVS